ncbi:pentatricopeptide repeat protein [Talaromyces stipitatus ATCC 10500]|uniref:Pentatricopeptide repeat protein n=1 Tax=Talaromyces stipitatus (strain ATCC 10500 / CBS 375.48 / QM 6759 / NRRL 1006) TaxID=441959 RepID=B8MHN8_TALSN|nr:pentatricopeptide repeat protein [Talaromyces stipitatus ATCC 10500]EED16019.1 pentatricopeptide repeat protein [Talaromyces stipitatus ATCC 10500]
MLRQVIQGAGRLQYQAGSFKFSIAKTPILFCSFSTTASQAIRYGGPNDKIRIFEQPSRTSSKRVEIDPDAEATDERKELEIQLAKLDKELVELSKGPFDPDGPFIQSLPEKERIAALEVIRKFEAEHGPMSDETSLEQIFDKDLDDMIKKEFEQMAKEEEDIYDMSKPAESDSAGRGGDLSSMHPYELRFRKQLELHVDSSEKANAQELWRWYQRCKDAIPSFLPTLEQEIYQLLWNIQLQGQVSPTTRMTHIRTLVEDLNTAGKALLPNQVLEYINVLHEGGDTENALQLWEESQAIVSQGEGDINAYWSTGVRLFAAHGDPQRAQDIAFAFLASGGSRNARILIPIATAWTKQTSSQAATKAWAIYLQLKTLLGTDMKMEDYDALSTAFLNDGKVNLALAVFKDMMITGKDPANDSTAIFQRAIGLKGPLRRSNIKEEVVNKISLSALTFLPRRLQSKFFYASWMKKLIGMGDVDSAAAVVELMFERGVKPDAIHLNGIIGGWLRNGSATSRDKAEQLGWSMIQHRIDTVWSRIQHSEESTKPSVPELPGDRRVPSFLKRTLPPANIETFSILLLHYTRRGDDDMVKYLNKCLGDAQIRPNSYYMNHLLYAELRKQHIHSLWEKFQLLTRQVAPDLETFACLWDCGKLQYDRFRTAYDTQFPTVRQLFTLMMRWYSTLDARKQKITQEEFSKELYDQITLCFCLSKDLCGTLVALYVMRDLFNLYPDENTARMLVLQIARIANNINIDDKNHPPGTSRRSRVRARRRLSTTPQSKENIEQIRDILATLQTRKASVLQARGIDVQSLSDQERKQYQLEILSELLISVIERTVVPAGSDRDVRARIVAAMEEMGVHHLAIRFHHESLQ